MTALLTETFSESGPRHARLSRSLDNRPSTPVTDSGTFSTYAGGVVVTGTNGKCIYVSGSLSLGTGSVNQFRAAAGPVACG